LKPDEAKRFKLKLIGKIDLNKVLGIKEDKKGCPE